MRQMKKEFRFSFGVCDIIEDDAQKLFNRITEYIESLDGRIVEVELSWRVDIRPGPKRYYFKAEERIRLL